MDSAAQHKPEKQNQLPLSLAALGVVFGDIATSPLYALNELFFGRGHTQTTPETIRGAISLVVWVITAVISIKYLVFVLRADNDGEGGVFALYARLNGFKRQSSAVAVLLVVLILAAGMLIGDGMITPAISVLSAVEGLSQLSSRFTPFVLPITLGVLGALFAVQKQGTAKIGTLFGPIIAAWLLTIGAIGAHGVWLNPGILAALNPIVGIQFAVHLPPATLLLLLGAVMLVITGGEALYADMGHFGATPIRKAWFSLAFPCLLLNYLGQGAYLLSGGMVRNGAILYSMVPASLLIPLILLASAATVVASQALISGAFSLTVQAVGLGLFPRLRVLHTHHEHEGQTYISVVCWALFAGCAALVLGFKSSTGLAAAYGLAVSCDMLVTSISMMAMARYCWNWPRLTAAPLFGTFALLDGLFVTANSQKLLAGGWIPLTAGALLFVAMTTWRWGRKATAAAYTATPTITMRELVEWKRRVSDYIDHTVLFMCPRPILNLDKNVPALLQVYLNRYGKIPRNLILLDVIHTKSPLIHDPANRYEVRVFDREETRGSIVSVTVLFGFMEDPNVEEILEALARHHEIALEEDPTQWHVMASQERLISGPELTRWQHLRLSIFRLLRRNSLPAYYYYGLGTNVGLSIEVFPIRITE